MLTIIKLDTDEIKKAIMFYLKNGPAKKEVKRSISPMDNGKPCIYLAQGGVANSSDPREHTFIYAECEIESI